MKPIRIVWIGMIMAICFGLFIVPAQAHDVEDGSNALSKSQDTGALLVSVEREARGHSLTVILLYDKAGNTVNEVSTRSNAYRFANLKTGAYRVIAYNEEIGVEARADAEVESAKTAAVSIKLETQSAPKAFDNNGSCSREVSGDINQIKVTAFGGPVVVYLQCGKVVATYGDGGCSCGGGSWRYVNNCQKSQKVYVTLPCNRGHK